MHSTLEGNRARRLFAKNLKSNEQKLRTFLTETTKKNNHHTNSQLFVSLDDEGGAVVSSTNVCLTCFTARGRKQSIDSMKGIQRN